MKPEAALPLQGARKKPEPKPRTEGVVKLAHRPCYYARLYVPGAKRAKYVSTGRRDVQTAAQLIPHLRAKLRRPDSTTPPPSSQPCFDLSEE